MNTSFSFSETKWRFFIPVLFKIHSSEVSTNFDKSSLETIFFGKYEPTPVNSIILEIYNSLKIIIIKVYVWFIYFGDLCFGQDANQFDCTFCRWLINGWRIVHNESLKELFCYSPRSHPYQSGAARFLVLQVAHRLLIH